MTYGNHPFYVGRNKIKKNLNTSHFSSYITSINDESDSIFMSYQNTENEEFAKEQERWLKEIKYRRKEGFIFEPKIESFEKINQNTGYLTMNLKIIRPSGRERILKGKFFVIKNESSKWLINDFPFLELRREEYTIKYFQDNEDEVNVVNQFIMKVLPIYKKLFKWNPKNISIKIFDTLDQISLSIPIFAIYGWNEEGEAIKVLVPQYVEDKTEFLQNLISHELSHKMLSNLTNDNASLYIQEGLAVYLEKSLLEDEASILNETEELKYHLNEVIEYTKNDFLSVNELNMMNYDDGEKIYYHGFLLVYFLLEKFGVDRFLDFTSLLSNYEYEDTRIEYKLSLINERTLNSLAVVYGDLEDLLNQLKKYYSSLQK